MSICTDILRTAALTPRRVRRAECSAFKEQNRFINFTCSLNLTPDPQDNDPTTGLAAWTVADLPVQVAFQDVADRGTDLAFVAIGNRVYLLDYDRTQDEWNWDTVYPIYRRLTFGPVPGSREEQEDGRYRLPNLKRFRRFSYELAEDPVAESEYRVSVRETGAAEATAATGLRTTQRHGDANVAKKGYSFLVSVEHQANEAFPLLWWEAEYEDLGRRRANDPIP